jgi:arginine-tRNA-protein transferase
VIKEEQQVQDVFKGEVLDNFLSHGWYRQGSTVFTTHFISPFGDEKHYRVFWLRYKVSAVKLSSKSSAIVAANRAFTVTCRPFQYSKEIDDLHARYAGSLKFFISESIADKLQDFGNRIFDTHLIEVRDNGKLIGGGVFDLGANAIEGIVNFYDPGYKKFSLGKFLIIQKYRYCAHNKLEWYYPGYYSVDHPIFDYKLFLDKKATEVYVPEAGLWIDYPQFEGLLKK